MQLAPEIFLGEHVGQLKLRFEFFCRRKQSQLHIGRAECVRRERIQRELNATSFHQLSMKFLLGCFFAARAAQIKSAPATGFVVDDPEIVVTKLRLLRLVPSEDQIDPAADTKLFCFAQ